MIYRVLNGLKVILVSCLVFLPFIQKASVVDSPYPFSQFQFFLDWFQPRGWWIGAYVGGCYILVVLVLKFVTPPRQKELLQSLMDIAKEFLLDKNVIADDHVHHHRVTLFRHKSLYFIPKPKRGIFWWWGKGRYPWSGWLVPVARSGHTTKNMKSSFLAPDDADAAEGVAGQAWSKQRTLALNNLREINSHSTDQEILAYSKETWVSLEWVKNKLNEPRPLCRSLCGIPIEINNKPWGVIVVDSTKPNAIVDPKLFTGQLMQLETILDTIV